ncbi:MAG: argininosuccinate synthase [SAR202 cluster bacterium]|nr:argininosuccinate synthase [SAR202 cluster bacterium]
MKWDSLLNDGFNSIAGAVSGGLDSCTVTHWLTSKGFTVNCYTVDLGQPDESNIDSIKNRMIASGASKSEILPGKKLLAKAGLKVIQAQAKYEGGYWNTTGIARPITTQIILEEIQDTDTQVFFHGATGRGNDQVRFQLAVNMMNPSMNVYAPWRDPEFIDQFPGRQEMIDYCHRNGIPIGSKVDASYSTDANLLGLTHEAGDLEDVQISPSFVTPGMGVWPYEAPDKPEIVSINWVEGIPTEINGDRLGLVEIFERANNIGGRNGVGIGNHVVENRFVGVKSRGLYESPGMELLGSSYEYLLQFMIDRRAREFFEEISSVVSKQIYQGYWMDLATVSALNALKPITQLITGKISVKLYKGKIEFDSIENTAEAIPNSLYTDDSSMEAVGSYSHLDAEGFLQVLGVSAKNIGKKQFKFIKDRWIND